MDYDASLTPLYPSASSDRALRNLYLEAPLEPPGWHGELFIYSNFVTSLDGRIALDTPAHDDSYVPASTANPRDWRLFQELAARADVLITSGRYLRQFSAGTAQDVLPIGEDEAFADIRRWRRSHDLPEQPDIAIISTTLDFELPASLLAKRRRVLILTDQLANDIRKTELRECGCDVMECDRGPGLTGHGVATTLRTAGYRRAYAITGPQILHTLVADGELDSLFLTMALRLLGGVHFSTILEGELLPEPVAFNLRTLYLDRHAPAGAGQLLACFDRR